MSCTRRTAIFVAIFAVTLFPYIVPASAGTMYGRSRDLGIRFLVKGGSHWCRADITVRLTASSAKSFHLGTRPFLDMLGRIRAVVTSQCPRLARIDYAGFAHGHRVFSAETLKLTGWQRLLLVNPATDRPVCPHPHDVVCAARARAYVVARDLMRGPAFSDVTVTSTMSPDSNDLAFSDKDVSGKLMIAPLEPHGGLTPNTFAKHIAASTSEICRARGGAFHLQASRKPSAVLAMRTVVCRVAAHKTATTAILVWRARHNFRIFDLLQREGPTFEERELARRLAVAIQRDGRYSEADPRP